MRKHHRCYGICNQYVAPPHFTRLNAAPFPDDKPESKRMIVEKRRFRNERESGVLLFRSVRPALCRKKKQRRKTTDEGILGYTPFVKKLVQQAADGVHATGRRMVIKDFYIEHNHPPNFFLSRVHTHTHSFSLSLSDLENRDSL